jgi:hypothetical protein
MLDNPMNTFHYCYDFEGQGRSLMLIRCAKHAKDLGASKQQVLNLMEDVQSYWINPLEEERYQRTIVSQLERWEF